MQTTLSSDSGHAHSDPTNRGDLHESFDLGPEGESADGSVQHNVWPNAALLPDFKHVAKTYYRQCTDVYRKVLKLLALSLGLEEGWFEDKSDRDASILRCESCAALIR